MDAVSVKRFVGWVLEGISESAAVCLLRLMRMGESPQAEGLPERTAAGTPLRVLVLCAHPDDESLNLGGAIAAHVAQGDVVTVVVLTDGAASRAGGLDPMEMAARRAVELQEAILVLGSPALVHLGLAELSWDIARAAEALAPACEASDLLYTHGPVDFHPDHFRVAELAARLASDRHRVLIFETQVLLTPILVNRRVALSPADSLAKVEAAMRHRTQAGTVAASLRRNDIVNRCYRSTAVEVFWEVSPAALRRIAAAMPIDPARTPFRGMRLRGFSDPLSVIAGTWARIRLRRLARD